MIRKIVKSAGAVIFREENGNMKYLLLKHKRRGHWGFPKGRIKNRETEKDAALREIKEETGIKNMKFISFRKKEKYIYNLKNKKFHKEVIYFLAKTKEGKIKLSNEHIKYSWTNFEDTIKKIEKENLKQLVNRVHRILVIDRIKKSNKQELLIISYPKCGRTWLTMILARIMQKKYGFKEEEVINIEKMSSEISNIPKIKVIHEDNPHLKTINELSKNKKRYSNKKIIFLIRDPRDVIVSFYFHQSRRKKKYKGTISKFLFEKNGGFDNIIEYYNIWKRNKEIPKGFIVVKYEDLKRMRQKKIRMLLKFIGIRGVSETDIEESLQFASFKNMRKMEAENRFRVNRLRSKNIKDINSYKIRRGVIGGYRDYLNNEDIEKLNEKMKRLSKFYKYNI